MNKTYAESLLYTLHTIPVNPGRFPKIKEISEKLNMPKYRVTKLLKQLVEIGYLNRVGNWFSFVKETPLENAIEENHNDFELGNKTVALTKNKDTYTIYFIKGIFFIVGIFASILSMKYTQVWFNERLSLFWSWVFSSVIVLFISALFVAITYIFIHMKQWYKWVIIPGLVIVLIITLFLSIISTVAGQYNQTKIASAEKQEVSQDAIIIDKKVELLLETKQDLLDAKEVLKGRLSEVDIELLKYTKDDYQWDSLQNRKVSIIKEIDNKNIELKKIRDKESEYLDSGKVFNVEVEKKNNFYDYINKIFKKGREATQFIIDILPAIFLDLIAPTSFCISLFLKKKEEV
jgi:uncharacterized membrane protein